MGKMTKDLKDQRRYLGMILVLKTENCCNYHSVCLRLSCSCACSDKPFSISYSCSSFNRIHVELAFFLEQMKSFNRNRETNATSKMIKGEMHLTFTCDVRPPVQGHRELEPIGQLATSQSQPFALTFTHGHFSLQ